MGKDSSDKRGFTYRLGIREEFAKMGLSPSDWSLWEVLVSHSDEEGLCWPSKRMLIQRAGMSERTAKRSFLRLEELCLLKRELRTGHSSVYRLDLASRAKMAPLPVPKYPSPTRAKMAQGGGQNGPQKIKAVKIKQLRETVQDQLSGGTNDHPSGFFSLSPSAETPKTTPDRALDEEAKLLSGIQQVHADTWGRPAPKQPPRGDLLRRMLEAIRGDGMDGAVKAIKGQHRLAHVEGGPKRGRALRHCFPSLKVDGREDTRHLDFDALEELKSAAPRPEPMPENREPALERTEETDKAGAEKARAIIRAITSGRGNEILN